MSRILVACAVSDFGPKFDAAAAAVRAQAAGRLEVVPADAIDWKAVMRDEAAGWPGAYRWAARVYDAVAVVETAAGGLGRGTFEIAREFVARGKPVYVVAGGRATPCRVEEWDVTDWKQRYGRVVAPF